MFHVEIDGKTIDLPNLTSESTEYEYSKAIADVLIPYIRDRKAVVAEIYQYSKYKIHALQVIPKGDSVMVTDNTSRTMPLAYQFVRSKKILPEKYLVMVNAEHNNNKFYRMVDCGDGTFNVFYGRIGETQGTSRFANHIEKPFTYRAYMYYIKYYEKITKGYEDKSKLHKAMSELTVKNIGSFDFEGIDPDVKTMLEFLINRSKQVIEKNYTIRAEDVTEKMVKLATTALNSLKTAKRVETFNKRLLDLMHIIPRRISIVSEEIAKGEKDYPRIILRETELLEVVKGHIALNSEKQAEELSKQDRKNILDTLNLEIYPATQKQIAEVKEHLPPDLTTKLLRVYRVINKNTQKRFDDFIKVEKGGNCVVKQFWHGSVNENWLSILQQGLVLNPNASITGKMFGKGIYFAPSAKKSWGYTSARGSYWAKGNDSKAFMGLYATAYGTPYTTYSNQGFLSSFGLKDFRQFAPNCDCVHAKKGACLVNDEIVFYDEAQTTINYICEFIG